jgi:hypothetical protein
VNTETVYSDRCEAGVVMTSNGMARQIMVIRQRLRVSRSPSDKQRHDCHWCRESFLVACFVGVWTLDFLKLAASQFHDLAAVSDPEDSLKEEKMQLKEHGL